MCGEPFGVLGSQPTGELLSLNSNPADLKRIRQRGYRCGYILGRPIRDHWFSVAIVLSRTQRRINLTDQLWLEHIHNRHLHFERRINPYRRGLLPQRQRQILKMISEEKLDKEIAAALINLQTRERGISERRLGYFIKQLCDSLEGAPEARWSHSVKRQIGLLGVCAKYGLI